MYFRMLPDAVDETPLWVVEMLTQQLQGHLVSQDQHWEQWFEGEPVGLDLPPEWEEILAEAREDDGTNGGFTGPPPGWETMPRAKE